MPEKPLTVLTYAASASLAAIALVYFFNPNYLIDGDTFASSASTRKKGIVGLSNPANDCFINSVLQSLSGLGDLRLYLIRELHRRALDGPEIYSVIPNEDENGKPTNKMKTLSLQSGEVTRGLKEMIDGLNERPIYKKTISAGHFIGVLEHAFNTRISKSQQDAQELLQVVAERLSEEYHAGKAARKRARSGRNDVNNMIRATAQGLGLSLNQPKIEGVANASVVPPELDEIDHPDNSPVVEDEEGFPLEGRTESQIECQHCHFIPKANPVTFVMLTLPVPQKSSTSLNECFDAHFKTEYIDDYKCDKCRLEHALMVYTKELSRAKSERERTALQSDIDKLKLAIEEDPEKPPEGVKLPDSKSAPDRRIARHVRITDFPKILVIHLQRSIYDIRSSSTKNAAKVSFPERFPIGGLINRRNYKLLGVVTHKGTHNSGHYESMRRQHLYAPYSTPNVQNQNSPYSAATTPNLSAMPSPNIRPKSSSPVGLADDSQITSPDIEDLLSPSTASSSPSRSSVALSPPSTRPSSGSGNGIVPAKRTSIPPASPLRNSLDRSAETVMAGLKPSDAAPLKSTSTPDYMRLPRKKKTNDRWWRISDDKIKECKTGDVLGMQREVYMLFYEIEKS
ncbi:hypothetical protein MMC34_002986 [Xylographa carneopallida]|nr:hypothetical protein [Xylographa carneopallida]